ncbi:hypothetical protein FRB99_004018 [Tulasnella sp. 403]|nr:hypothetical protein FRB99_004018 [Tulasnella sp. 403]
MNQATVTAVAWTQQTSPSNPNATSPYVLLGDHDSIVAVTSYLQSNCSANVAQPTAFNPNDPNAIQPQQIVQFYRASSFALALTSYNNPANNPANAPASNDSALSGLPDVPIPPGTNLTFLDCVNNTIGANVPVLESRAFQLVISVDIMGQVGFLWIVLYWMKLV